MKNLTDQLLFALVARIPIFAFILSASVVNALLCCSNVAIAQTPQISADRSQPSQRETSKSERGITGSTTFYYDGPALQAKVQREAATPLVLRIQRGTQPSEYQARYIGNVSGRYDLRDWLEHTDGSPIAATEPLMVEVVSTLPNDPRSDLFDVDGFQPTLRGGYRLTAALLIMLWLAVPVGLIVRRLLKRPDEIAAPVAVPRASLVEQIRPLIRAAAGGQMSIGDKARLELLLVHHFRQQASLPELDMARSIQLLRQHSQAGPIIAAVEQWLHAASSAESSNAGAEDSEDVRQVLRLLEPLRAQAEEPVATAGSARP